MPSPAIPAAVLSLIAFGLLVVCTVSTPIWDKVYFLHGTASVAVNSATTVAGGVNLGVFGYCETGFSLNSIAVSDGTSPCSARMLGYYYEPSFLGISFSLSDSQRNLFKAATTALVVVPISAALAGSVFLLSIFSLCVRSRCFDVLAFLVALLAVIAAWVSWVGNLVIMIIARNKLSSEANGQLSVSLGNALWIQLAGAVMMLLAMCASAFAICGPHRRDRRQTRAHAQRLSASPSNSPELEHEKLYRAQSTEGRWE